VHLAAPSRESQEKRTGEDDVRENVGGMDRAWRALVGPGLLALGYARWGGREGTLGGLLAMLSGVLITETAITRVCPLNEVLTIDTARRVRLAK
jgi:hypothetical protein